ncbi:hypothetical protein JCM9279_003184 [Rhodotorula babjevae]
MATPPCPIPPPLPPAGARAPQAAPTAAGHSYSASLPPTYRLSAFPVSPSAQDCSTSTATFTLAPGLGLEQRGCDSGDDDADDDDSARTSSPSTSRRRLPSPSSSSSSPSSYAHRPTRTTRGFDCPNASSPSSLDAAKPASGTDLRSTSTSSARSSSSCTDTSASASTSTSTSATEDDPDDCATPLSSLAGSTISMTASSDSCRAGPAAAVSPTTSATAAAAAAPRPPPPTSASSNLAARLEWGLSGLVVAPQVPKDDAAKREREARAVRGGWEDPALAAARRALWDDVVSADEDEGAPLVEAQRAQGEGASAQVEGDDGDADVSESHDDDDGASEDAARDDEDDEDEASGLPRVRRPCHTTLAPRFSCLRHSPSARASLSLPSSSCPSSSEDGPLPSSTSTPTLLTSGRLSPSAASTTSTSEGAPASVTFSCAPPETCPTWSAEAYSRRGDAPVEKLSIREWIELQGVREAVGVWSGKIAKWDEAQQLAAEASAGAGAGGDGQLSTPTRGRPPGGLAAVVGVVHISRSTPTSPVDPNRMPFP